MKFPDDMVQEMADLIDEFLTLEDGDDDYFDDNVQDYWARMRVMSEKVRKVRGSNK